MRRPDARQMVITIDQAIELAMKNNPSVNAKRTLISQNKEQEVTANLRPNPMLSWDAQYLPFFTPDLWSSDYIDNMAQFDLGVGYLFERGKKRQHRLQAAQDATAVTEAQVRDFERSTVANTAQQFIAASAGEGEPGLRCAPARQLSAHRQHQRGAEQGRRDEQGRPAEDPVADAAVPDAT